MFCFHSNNSYSLGIPGMWPNPPHATANEAEESSSYGGSKVMVSNDNGNGLDGEDKCQSSNRFIVSKTVYSIAPPLLLE